MESTNSVLEGDGPQRVEDFDKSQEEINWANLPSPVFCTLFSKMTPSFVFTARQVCPNWLQNTENEVGLNVKIDDTIPGNLEFVQSVKAVQARIVNWTDTSSQPSTSLGFPPNFLAVIFKFPSCLQKLTLTGKMPETWNIKHLQEFPNLSHLVIRSMALHSQDMTGLPLPTPPTDLASQQPDSLSMYENYESPIEEKPIWLSRLRKLEIIMNEFSYPSALPLSIRLHDPEQAINHELNLQRLFFVVLNNVTYILNNVRSRMLQVAQVYVYPKAGTATPSKINWRHVPLQRFLENHKRTLKQLYLPDYEGKHTLSEADLLSYPTKLKKLQLTLSKYVGDREENREQSCKYWSKFLSEQTNLCDVYLILSDLSTEWIRDCLSSLAFSSKDHLHYVDIVIQDEETVQVNMEIFAYCHSLEILKVSGRDNEIVIRNFCKLPSSLRKLYASMAHVEMPDPQFLHKYSNLEMLEIKTLSTGEGHLRTVEMMRQFLSLRRLSLLSLTFDTPINSNRILRELLEIIDEDFISAYPNFMIKLHLSYELEGGWGEETFDEERLEIEYINSREPEEYATWHTGHRNAISVDDEDHRIFIFQTLPFLLDLRGQTGDPDDDDDDISDDDDDQVIGGDTPDSIESTLSAAVDTRDTGDRDRDDNEL